ncbi:MAG: glycosyltransferase family 4 protein [Planctomycetaceae bacterium]|nr:glycosyltransferase family 4 protein [Planctomycetaceae bacterium]
MSGGLASYLGRLCSYLANQGHDIHVFTRSSEEGIVTSSSVNVHRVVPWWSESRRFDRFDPAVPRMLYSPYQDIKAAWSLSCAVRNAHDEKPFDMVQLSNVMGTGLFFRKSSIPLVMRLSSFKPDCVAANGGADSLAERVRMRIERRSVRQQKHLFAPSFLVAERVESFYRTNKLSVIETPFFKEDIKNDPSILSQKCGNKPYLLFFGRLSRLKGVHLLADALPDLMNSIPEMEAVFIGADSNTAPGGGQYEKLYLRKVIQLSRPSAYIAAVAAQSIISIYSRCTLRSTAVSYGQPT